MLPELKIYQPIVFGIFLTFVTIKIGDETKQQNLISARIEYLEPHYLSTQSSMYGSGSFYKLVPQNICQYPLINYLGMNLFEMIF